MSSSQHYPIGIPGKPWEIAHKSMWLGQQMVKRKYRPEVIEKLNELRYDFDMDRYGALSCAPGLYPMFALKNIDWDDNKPVILITGGVHGYETSGVQGAIRFMQTRTKHYSQWFNIIVAPCLSPWGYETINRWNPRAVDPNRSFTREIYLSPTEESAKFMQYIKDSGITPLAHFDLHETTDTDNSEFRPALAARDAIEQKNWNIPDGFYLVADSEKPVPEFQKAIIEGVQAVTHIAPADENNKLIGVPLEQEGVINYKAAELCLCMGFSEAKYVTTTEVYPDSAKVDDENCILAQVAAITSGLDFIIKDQGMS
jgi:hypothetical protein